VGISTDKLHARGPVGPQELTSYKWIAYGDGHLRDWSGLHRRSGGDQRYSTTSALHRQQMPPHALNAGRRRLSAGRQGCLT